MWQKNLLYKYLVLFIKKLVLILAIFILIINISKKAYLALLFKYIFIIYYLMQFKKNQAKIQVLIDFKNKVNIIAIIHIIKLELRIRFTKIKA